MLKPKSIVFIAVGLLAFSRLDAAPVAGQPDAGSIMRSQNPQRELPGVLPSKEKEKPLARPERRTELSVTGSVGKTLDWNGLQTIAARVTSHLHAKGWFLAEAYLPEQDLSSGVVTIAIVQGKSDGGIKVERDDSVRISKHVLEGIAFSSAEDGKALNLPRLERSRSRPAKGRSSPGLHGATIQAIVIPEHGGAVRWFRSTTRCITATD